MWEDIPRWLAGTFEILNCSTTGGPFSLPRRYRGVEGFERVAAHGAGAQIEPD
jgi:hypothetical protein